MQAKNDQLTQELGETSAHLAGFVATSKALQQELESSVSSLTAQLNDAQVLADRTATS